MIRLQKTVSSTLLAPPLSGTLCSLALVEQAGRARGKDQGLPLANYQQGFEAQSPTALEGPDPVNNCGNRLRGIFFPS